MLTQYLQTGPFKLPGFIKFLLGAMIFWDILYRAQQATTISFLEDIWARNLLNIFVAPVRLSEFIVATYCVGFVKILITVAGLSAMAGVFYHFNILSMGWHGDDWHDHAVGPGVGSTGVGHPVSHPAVLRGVLSTRQHARLDSSDQPGHSGDPRV